MKSSSLGDFCLKEFLSKCSSSYVADFENYIEENLIAYTEEVEELETLVKSEHVTENENMVLIYITGYIVHKIGNAITCIDCKKFLHHDREITVEYANNALLSYLKFIDRGGLKYPTDYFVSLVINLFLLFKILISEKFESHFLKEKSQKSLFVQLGLNYLKKNQMLENTSCYCGQQFSYFYKKCLTTFANILLNNYRKLENDKIVTERAERKLKKLASKK